MRPQGLTLLLPLLLPPLAALARPAAAEPADGRFAFSVLIGESGGPPYPAAPVEMAVTHRDATGTGTPSGRLLLIPVDATDVGTGDPVALAASAADDGAMGEPGDTAVMDVYFDPGSPAVDLPALSRFLWASRPEPEAPSGPIMEWTSGQPARLDAELFFDDYEVEVYEVGSEVALARGRVRTSFAIADGQDLAFEDVSASPPDDASEIRYTGNLRRVAGGSFDPAQPLYRVTVSNTPVATLPAIPALWLVAVAVAVAGAAACRPGTRGGARARDTL